MKCRYVSENLSAYIDGELDEKESRLIAAHLLACHHCRSQWEELKAASALLNELPELTPPPEFITGLRERLASIPASVADDDRAKLSEKVRLVARKPWYKIAAVAAVFSMALGIGSMWNDGNGNLDFVGPQLARTETPAYQPIADNQTEQTTDAVGQDQDAEQVDNDTRNTQQNGEVKSPIDQNQELPQNKPSNQQTAEPAEKFSGKPEASNRLTLPAEVTAANHSYVAITSAVKINVDDVDSAAAKVAAVAQKYGGTVSTANPLNMYIPVANYYSGFLGELNSLGDVSESSTSEDLTAKIRSLEEQLVEKQQKEAALLKDADENDQETAAVQSEIKELYNQIQALKISTKNVKVVLELIPVN